MTEYSDKEIIECLKARDGDAVRFLLNRYMPMIRLMVVQLGGTNEDAKDIFQDALLVILKRIDNQELVLSCKFKTFFYCICENLWKNVLTSRQAAMNYLSYNNEIKEEQDFSEIYDNKLYENMFYDLFNSLDPACQKILKLYWQEFSPREIAEKLGFSYGYVRKKKCECQGDLIARINKHPEYIKIKESEENIKSVVIN